MFDTRFFNCNIYYSVQILLELVCNSIYMYKLSKKYNTQESAHVHFLRGLRNYIENKESSV